MTESVEVDQHTDYIIALIQEQQVGFRVRDGEEFTENLEDEGVLGSRDTPANTSQDSDSERPTKVVSRKHSVYTHFPKDRNCEICKSTKITRAPCRKRTGEASRFRVALQYAWCVNRFSHRKH